MSQDLPEPKKRILTPEQRRLRSNKLIRTFLVFVAAYSALHKVFIPLGLKFTSLNATPFAEIDIWVVHPFLLLWLTRTSLTDERTRLVAVLAGAGIVYGIYEWILTLNGYYEGWLAFSRTVASTPFAICCFFMMLQRKVQQPTAWIGALTLGTLLAAYQFYPVTNYRDTPDETESRKKLKTQPAIPVASSKDCGLKEFQTTSGAYRNKLLIEGCGLRPPILGGTENRIHLTNKTSDLTNLHMVILNADGKKRQAWNIGLPAHAALWSPSVEIHPSEIGIIYSDSNRKAGVAAFLPAGSTVDWNIKRSPVTAEQRNPQ